ncbi:TetR/AcrR family transcriptional regulator [Lacticaseibacillus camelliae]|uniref:TetR/AcrR family transcriptional regulator n=1 Tax=Lacticaseibacillus camelliae TaxID=381742 RepID=UPI000A6F6EA2|nr:TetR/AcrR family transcriptional regulator [Lacticaseibacillus camelliae]
MPKPTFFRLAETKRKRLIKAAYDEFSRASFQDASISNIIKEAGIPRGSFYQYFEDKSDIFFLLAGSHSVFD